MSERVLLVDEARDGGIGDVLAVDDRVAGCDALRDTAYAACVRHCVEGCQEAHVEWLLGDHERNDAGVQLFDSILRRVEGDNLYRALQASIDHSCTSTFCAEH